MDVFRDLYLHGSEEQIATFIGEVERALADGWTRDGEAEASMRSLASRRDEPTYCFTCTDAGKRPAATVFLAQKEPGLFHVSNVVPKNLHQLSYEQYNGILEELYERFVRLAAERTSVRADLTESKAGLEKWLSREAAERLRRFSAHANKSTGSSHPSDQQLWMAFIVAAQRERSRLDASTLRRWLIEVEGWQPEVADDLALEYDFGKDILAFAGGDCVRA